MCLNLIRRASAHRAALYVFLSYDYWWYLRRLLFHSIRLFARLLALHANWDYRSLYGHEETRTKVQR